MSPGGLAKVFAALALLVLAIGAGFAAAGAWLILPFAGLEVLLLGAAFMLHARHAADYERIEEEGRVLLRDTKEELEIGRHLGAEARAEFAAEPETRLIRGRNT